MDEVNLYIHFIEQTLLIGCVNKLKVYMMNKLTNKVFSSCFDSRVSYKADGENVKLIWDYNWGSFPSETPQSSEFMFRVSQSRSFLLFSLKQLYHREMSRVFYHLLLFTTNIFFVNWVNKDDLLHRLKSPDTHMTYDNRSVLCSWFFTFGYKYFFIRTQKLSERI